MYLANVDPDQGEIACVLMLIDFFPNIRKITKGILNTALKLIKIFRCQKEDQRPRNKLKSRVLQLEMTQIVVQRIIKYWCNSQNTSTNNVNTNK